MSGLDPDSHPASYILHHFGARMSHSRCWRPQSWPVFALDPNVIPLKGFFLHLRDQFKQQQLLSLWKKPISYSTDSNSMSVGGLFWKGARKITKKTFSTGRLPKFFRRRSAFPLEAFTSKKVEITVPERCSVTLVSTSRLQMFLFLFFYGEHSSEETNKRPVHVKSSLNKGICYKSSKSFFTLYEMHFSIYTILHPLEAAWHLRNK